MKCKILHECKGRIRLHAMRKRMTLEEADQLKAYLSAFPAVQQAKVYERTCDMVVHYDGSREDVIRHIAAFQFDYGSMVASTPENSGRALSRLYQERIIRMVSLRAINRLFMPSVLRRCLCIINSIRFIWKGIKCVLRRKMDVSILDALSIGISIARGDHATASSVMFMLRLSEELEEWTRKKALSDLARSMSLNVDRAWLRTDDGSEVLVPLNQVKVGDVICIRTGSVIPLDGRVVEGDSSVNQASLTGESMAVHKWEGSFVYAGSVVEEGECVMRVGTSQGVSRYDQIVAMIQECEKLKSNTEDRALDLADKLVPFSLAGTVLMYLLTRNVTRAVSILMVDFSCALKLSMPLAVLSAMRECGDYHITVKGGKYLEVVAKADTIVFDKTGTLTYACPAVVDVVPFGGWDPDKVLQIAACLEEHYFHSMANAVLKAAIDRGLDHEEMHTKPEYVVAHGIASFIDGKKTVIGSHHFVFEDEGCHIPEDEQEKFAAIPNEYSQLYLAVGGVLAGVICIFDPLKSEAPRVLNELRELGISKIIMMTGDNECTAAAVAKTVGVDTWYSGVMPEDKSHYVEKEMAEGRTVIMVGDGINDSPALSAADTGIAIKGGAAIAREIADITFAAEDLQELVTLRKIAARLQQRIAQNYRFVLGFNGALIALGAIGILPPATSALLHNTSTLGVTMHSMTNLLPKA
ncbi:MAG: heavy metal translocating P-type ATPase [Oscillospiraceae bacterium]|nr:heavy metal translocating P-type ATPase [Oscillospiraceae bacterium]